MKLDKATLIRNRFWIALGAAVGFTVIGWILLLVTVPASIAKEKKAVDTSWARNNNKNYNNFKHVEWIKQQEKETAMLEAEKSKAHDRLYKAQANDASVMDWPKMITPDKRAAYDLKDGLYALDVTIHPLKGKVAAPKETKDKVTIAGIMTEDIEADWFKVRDDKGKIHTIMKSSKTKINDSGTPKIASFGELRSRANHPVVVVCNKGKFFGEELTVGEIQAYVNTFRDQLTDIIKDLEPVNKYKDMVVQLRFQQPKSKTGKILEKDPAVVNDMWMYTPGAMPPGTNRFLVYPPLSSASSVNDISSDEIWATQESMWIQHEIFRQIKATNDSVAAFEMVESSKDGKHAKFRNFYWEVDLQIAKDTAGVGGVNVKLKNLRPHWQPVENLRFVVRFKDHSTKDAKPSEPVDLPPKSTGWAGYPVGPVGSGKDLFPSEKDGPKFIALSGVNMPGFHSLEQVLTVETAAVKRIDMISIGGAPTGEAALSHRHSILKLRPYNIPKKAAGKLPDTPPVEVIPKVLSPEEEEEFNRTEIFDNSVKLTPNGVLLERYLECTRTSRKLPVGMVLIVGPEHIARVQANLVSSPLRFLETQVFWQRYQLTLGGTPRPDPIAAATGAPKTASGDIQENVELHIYGVITLYERPGQ